MQNSSNFLRVIAPDTHFREGSYLFLKLCLVTPLVARQEMASPLWNPKCVSEWSLLDLEYNEQSHIWDKLSLQVISMSDLNKWYCQMIPKIILGIYHKQVISGRNPNLWALQVITPIVSSMMEQLIDPRDPSGAPGRAIEICWLGIFTKAVSGNFAINRSNTVFPWESRTLRHDWQLLKTTSGQMSWRYFEFLWTSLILRWYGWSWVCTLNG